jgi:hypothetical protein
LHCGEGTTERDGECVVADEPRVSNGGGGTGARGGASSTTGGANGTGGSPNEPPPPPGATADEVDGAAALCDVPEAGVAAVTSVEELEAHLAGRWLHCDGPVVFVRDDTAGIRFDRDGTFKFLIEGSEGELVDGVGFDDTGTWTVLDNGPGQYQVNIQLSGAGYNPAFFVFATEPAKMRLQWMLGNTDYAALDDR